MPIDEEVGSDLDMDVSEEEENDFGQDQYEEEYEDEIGDEDGEENEEPNVEEDKDDRLDRIEQQVQGLGTGIASQIAELKQGLTPQRQTEYTEEQLNELYKKNPVAVMRYLSQNQAQQQTADVQRNLQKDKYDDEAKSKYPLNDPKFRNVAERIYSEMLADGIPDTSPKLLLNVCKLAAAETGMAKAKKPAQRKPVRKNDTVERSNAPRQKSKSLDVNRLPRSVKNQVDLYAAHTNDPKKVEAFAKDALNDFKAKRRRRG